MRKQTSILDHVSHSPAQTNGIVLAHRLALEVDLPGIGMDEPIDSFEQRSLARPATPEQCHGFPLRDGKRDFPQHLPPGDGAAEVANFKNRSGRQG